MNPRRVLPCLAATAVFLLPASGVARPAGCLPAQIARDQPALSAEWRGALEAVVEATSREGQPWSCAGGKLFLEPAEGGREGVLLRLYDAQGRAVERHVLTPDDLLPIAEALLASPLHARDPSAEVPASGPSSPPPDVLPAAAKRPPRSSSPARAPRILIDGLLGARYGSPPRALWGAGMLRVAVPMGDFSVGVWARYGIPYLLERVPFDFSMSDMSIGLAGGVRLLAAPIELTASFAPSIVVTSMEGGDEEDHSEGSRVALRLGGGIKALLRWTETWRGIIEIDGELAPSELIKAHAIDPTLPPIPSWGLGVSLGVEAVIR